MDERAIAALPPRTAAVLHALLDQRGRVVGRSELAHRAGLSGLSTRRVDALVSDIRRRLGNGLVVTVRGRGWMITGEPAPIARSGMHPMGTQP